MKSFWTIAYEKLNWQHLVLLAIIVIVLYYSYKTIKTWVKNLIESSDEKKRKEALEAEAKKPGQEPTYSLREYANWANVLENAMAGFGTDEETIYAIYRKMRTYGDVVELEKAFGTRLWSPTTSYLDQALMGKNMDLPGWLVTELDSNELRKLNDILAAKNINYQIL